MLHRDRSRTVGSALERAIPPVFVVLLAAGCGPGGPTEPDPGSQGDPALGLAAFRADCASCHASGDGFDLAYFDFSPFDIVRRGVPHVDSATARDIAAYVETVDVERAHPRARPFQPRGGVAPTDVGFWKRLFGTEGWPDGVITEEWLRELDLRDVLLPVPFPRWSSERDESDWMPEVPLSQELLDVNGAVGTALEAYYDSPTEERLLAVVRAFQEIPEGELRPGSPFCRGAVACFEARRWFSSLAAIHFIRNGEFRDVPYEVAQLWWETGQLARVLYFLDKVVEDRTTVASWLAMSSIFAPDGFPGSEDGLVEPEGYMGQFLQSSGRPRLAVLITLRRLVSRGPLHANRPFNAYRDVQLASGRAPRKLTADVLEFGLDYLLQEQAAGRVPSPEYRDQARDLVDRSVATYERRAEGVAPQQDERIRTLIQRVRDGLSPD